MVDSSGGDAKQRSLTTERSEESLLRQLEAALVPRQVVAGRWGLAWRYHPSEDRMQLGGDFMGVHERRDGGLAVLIGDVSGRGASAAGLGVMLRAAWLTAVHADIDLEQMPQLLDELVAHHSATPSFATACFAELDADARALRLLRAGHEAPLLITRQQARFLQTSDAAHGPALGLGYPATWSSEWLALPPEAALLLYTDGLIEARPDGGGARLGLAGLHARIDRDAVMSGPPQQALDTLMASVLPPDEYALDDDLAMILIRPEPSPQDVPARAEDAAHRTGSNRAAPSRGARS